MEKKIGEQSLFSHLIGRLWQKRKRIKESERVVLWSENKDKSIKSTLASQE